LALMRGVLMRRVCLKHSFQGSKWVTVLSMVSVTDRVMDEVLSLPADQRMNLADRILESLNDPTDPKIDDLWAIEAERRVEQIKNGEVELVPGEQVFAEIHLKYAK